MAETKAATKDRILDAAEHLFAQKGFSETSLRDITTEAGANLAAVNYHFQSKDALIQAVFARLIVPANQERLRRLDALEAQAAGRPVPLEDILHALFKPIIELLSRPDGDNAARLVGLMFVEPGDLFERFFREQLAATSARFIAAIRRTAPEIPETEMYWRLLFAAGAMGHTVAGLRKIVVISGGRCDPRDIPGLLNRLVSFAAGGFRASANPAHQGEPSCKGSH